MKNEGMGEDVQGVGTQDRRANRKTARARERERQTRLRMAAYFIHNFLFHSEEAAAQQRTAHIGLLHQSQGGRERGEVR